MPGVARLLDEPSVEPSNERRVRKPIGPGGGAGGRSVGTLYSVPGQRVRRRKEAPPCRPPSGRTRVCDVSRHRSDRYRSPPTSRSRWRPCRTPRPLGRDRGSTRTADRSPGRALRCPRGERRRARPGRPRTDCSSIGCDPRRRSPFPSPQRCTACRPPCSRPTWAGSPCRWRMLDHRDVVSQSVPALYAPVVTMAKYDPSGANATSRM